MKCRSHHGGFALVFLVLLAACGKDKEPGPRTANIKDIAPLSAADQNAIEQRRDEDSISKLAANPQRTLPNGPSHQSLLQLLNSVWQTYGSAELDLTPQMPPVRSQVNSPLCNVFADTDMLSGIFAQDSSGISVLDAISRRDATGEFLDFYHDQNDLYRYAQGGMYYEESRWPFDQNLFHEANDLSWDIEVNFLTGRKMFFSAFESSLYKIEASDIQRNSHARKVSGTGPFNDIKFKRSALPAQGTPSLAIPPFKVFEIDAQLSKKRDLHREEKAALHNIVSLIFGQFYKNHHPIKMGICWNIASPLFKSYRGGEVEDGIAKDSCGAHAIVIVGIKNIGGKPYFKLRNSHGLRFGAGGYALLSFENYVRVLENSPYPFFSLSTIAVGAPDNFRYMHDSYYQGPLHSDGRPQGKGVVRSHYLGSLSGEFKAGVCKNCENQGLLLYDADYEVFSHSTNRTSTLFVGSYDSIREVQVGDTFFLEYGLEGARVKAVTSEGAPVLSDEKLIKFPIPTE